MSKAGPEHKAGTLKRSDAHEEKMFMKDVDCVFITKEKHLCASPTDPSEIGSRVGSNETWPCSDTASQGRLLEEDERHADRKTMAPWKAVCILRM